MATYADITPLWDLSQASSFSQLPDDDFLALLQKQFPTGNAMNYNLGGFTNGVNPQNISAYSLPSITPPSEDSSPSPASANNDSNQQNADDEQEQTLKRKASDEDMDDGRNQKNQHTSDKKGSTSRRKSGGGPDEHRLLKRKEQNRAAQRAFRERKEKHVKDLEDKVAALEAKNEQAASENENLRDLLSRLQSENVMLKQSSFTFAVPKTGETSASGSTPTAKFGQKSTDSLIGSSRSTSVVSTPPSTVGPSPKSVYSIDAMDSMDWTSLTSFDPAMLNLLDDSTPQPTATDGAMQMDFSFGAGLSSALSSKSPYTMIASNPMLMSYASTFESASPIHTASNDNNPFNFDMGALSSWPTPSGGQESGTLDELFGGYMQQSPVDFSTLVGTPTSASASPVLHKLNSHPSSAASPLSSASTLFTLPPRASPTQHEHDHDSDECPKTKEEAAKRIASEGASPFAPTTSPAVRKSADSFFGPMVTCQGSSFPKTEKSDQNIEVLSAWRTITSNPHFKDADINELCTEFTSKARCDGTKVVLEPQGVHHILEALSSRQLKQ